MSTRSDAEFDFDRTIGAWLDLGPTELSDRIVVSARAEIHRTRRRGAWRTPQRIWTPTFSRRLVAGLASVAVIVTLIGIGLRLPSPPPAGTNPSPSPSPSAGTNASPSPSHSEALPPPAGAFQVTGSMSTGRLGHTATLLLDGRVLVAGGSGWLGDAVPNLPAVDPLIASAELYDPATGRFDLTGSMATRRAHHTATLLADGRVLIAGGGNNGMQHEGLALASAELFDPARGEFVATGSMGGARLDAVAIRLADGRVLVVGGTTLSSTQAAGPIRSAELYDPATGTFSSTGSPSGVRFWAPVLLADGRVLGLDQPDEFGSPPSIETYDPVSGTFSLGQALPVGFYGATRLAAGRVLLIGADNRNLPPTEAILVADLYDPATRSIQPTGTERIDFQASTETLLGDGRVLMVGFTGPADSGPPTPSAVVYDPATETFSPSSPPAAFRQVQTATLLLDGRVLSVGGALNEGLSPAFSSAELFK
jgi:hypothetical protein